jgi:flagellar FliJ protein
MFRFRLQQVLDLREKDEQRLASQLAHVLGLEREAKQQLEGLRSAREAGAGLTASGTKRSVGELANLAFLLEQMDNHIQSASEAVDAAGDQVSQAKEALTAALQDRRIMDRLKDRHEESYKASTEQSDRRTMDEIALTRYVQNDQ